MLRLCIYLFPYSSAFLAQIYVAAVVKDFCSFIAYAFKIFYAVYILFFPLYT